MRRPLALVAVALVLVACGGDPADDAADAADAAPGDDDAVACDVPDPSPSWLPAMADDTVARLSGALPIRSGVTLIDRATPTRRDEARDFIVAALTELDLDVMLDDYGAGANVYAELPPTEGGATDWLVLGAHFDGVFGSPAANDNATGVAIVLAAARYLAEMPCRRRGVVVVLFDQEESGLIGSGNFAELLTAADLTIDSVHTIDQMGWDEDGDRAIELELPATGLQARYQAAAAAFDLVVPMVETTTSTSDHQAFRGDGFAAVGLTEEYVSGDTTPYYHLPGDAYATVDLEYLASTAALVDALVGRFAAGIGASARAGGTSRALPALAAARAGRTPVGPRPGWTPRPRR
jgi:acetylornithine deacetylase/succinyl-diaminopimelate desuccinylase-like protein